MQTVEELENYYHTHLSAKVEKLERVRKKIHKRIISVFIFTVLALLAVALIGFDLIIGFFAVLFVAVIAGAVLTGGLMKELNTGFKTKIIGSLVEFINENLTYDHRRGIGAVDFKQSKLFSQPVAKFKSEDLVSGMVGQTAISFSDVHASEKSRDNKGRTVYSTIFKGLFFVGDFNKKFHGETYVLPNIAGRLFGALGRLLQRMNMGRPPKVRLESQEFNREFVVYSSDPVECRYILTPALMERILNFRKAHPKRAFYISFVGDSIYVAISFSKNLFEPSLFKSLNDFSQIKEYYEDLYLAVSIVEEFNLNTRIWTKE